MASIYYQRIFVPGSFYHVYNRGAHQALLFRDAADYQTFTQILSYYLLHPLGTALSILARHKTDQRYQKNKDPIFVENHPPSHILLAYCLMPNHFHLMLKQLNSDLTISDFMRRLSVTYAMYFNDKYHHSGTIMQGKYKNILVENEYQWLYLSKYIHRNPLHIQEKQRSDLCKSLDEYPYSSYPNYLGKRNEKWVDTSLILDRYHRAPFQEYRSFVEDGAEYGAIERQTIDCNESQ